MADVIITNKNLKPDYSTKILVGDKFEKLYRALLDDYENTVIDMRNVDAQKTFLTNAFEFCIEMNKYTNDKVLNLEKAEVTFDNLVKYSKKLKFKDFNNYTGDLTEMDCINIFNSFLIFEELGEEKITIEFWG